MALKVQRQRQGVLGRVFCQHPMSLPLGNSECPCAIRSAYLHVFRECSISSIPPSPCAEQKEGALTALTRALQRRATYRATL
uniref:Uncharacterized protein n=1 Tax=Knipowitschia caucasica TaxID=637954 RepID=A0AAV2MQS2_KNICA